MSHTIPVSFAERTQLAPSVEFQQSLASMTELISPFVDRLIRFVRRFVGPRTDFGGIEGDIETAVREALANAIVHGNRENPDKRVWIACRYRADGELSISVRDEGRGFDVDMAGSGICLMKALMDEVSFEDRGTLVRMRKQIRRAI